MIRTHNFDPNIEFNFDVSVSNCMLSTDTSKSNWTLGTFSGICPGGKPRPRLSPIPFTKCVSRKILATQLKMQIFVKIPFLKKTRLLLFLLLLLLSSNSQSSLLFFWFLCIRQFSRGSWRKSFCPHPSKVHRPGTRSAEKLLKLCLPLTRSEGRLRPPIIELEPTDRFLFLLQLFDLGIS